MSTYALAYFYGDEAWVNYDECVLSVIGGKPKLLKLSDSLRKAESRENTRLMTAGSVTPFVTGKGGVLLVVYCLKCTTERATVNVPLDEKGEKIHVRPLFVPLSPPVCS